MTLLHTLTTVLLAAGILSSTIVRGHILSRPKSSRPEVRASFRAANTRVQISDPGNYISFSRERCEGNGGPTAYDDLESNLLQLEVYLKKVLYSLDRTMAKHGQLGLGVAVKSFCRTVPTLKEYAKDVADSIQACRDGEEAGRVIIANSFLEYICQAGEDLFAAFISDDGMECLASKKRELRTCIKQSLGGSLRGDYFVGDDVLELAGYEMVFALDTARCADVRKLQSCFVDVFGKCDTLMTPHTVNTLLNDVVITEKQCDDSSTDVESSASTDAQLHVSNELEGFESFMKEKCEKNGGPLAFDAAAESLKMIPRGIRLVDMTRLEAEIRYAAAESISDLDSMLTLHCRKAPIIEEIEKFVTETFSSCLSPEEEVSAEIFHNVTSSLLESVCYNDGNGIAAFIAADGIECFESKEDDLLTCVHQAFGTYFEAGGWKRRETPETPFIINLKDCHDMEKLRQCTVRVLAECEDKTPSYLLNSVFDTIRDGMLCEELLEAELREGMSETELLTERIKHFVRGNCATNDGQTASETLKNIIKYIATGAELAYMNMEQLSVEISEARLHGRVESVSKKYCRKVPALQKFVKHVRDYVATCMPSEDVDFQSTVILKTLDFICENEGHRFTKLLTSTDQECFNSNARAADNCIPLIYRGNSGLVKLREDLEANECTVFKQAQQCFVRVLNECEDPTAAQTADALLNFITEDTPCQ